jgi:hypothetical protein
MPSRLRLPLILVVLSVALAGCVGAPAPADDPTPGAPIGPVPAPAGPLTLQTVVTIVGETDASATATFTPGNAPSTSGDDLSSENDYWLAVGGRPEQCADVVSAPYLVSAADGAALDRLDDPSALIGTFTEIDEQRFGLIQVYARQFDVAAEATGFLDGFTATVQGCASYQLVDGDTVTWDAVGLNVSPLSDLPADVSGLRYVETVTSPPGTSVTTTFLQRDGVVVSVYSELTPTSSITQADVDAVAAAVAQRLGVY